MGKDLMFKKIAAAAVLAVLFAGSAKAEVIDISTIKCKDLGTMSKDEVSYVLVWLHGYFGGIYNQVFDDFQVSIP